MLSWRDEAGRLHEGTLFAAFAALARGEARSFPALRPHQREPWHAFTVQVAALALIRSRADALPTSEEAWRDLLLALSDGAPEAWELVVGDWSKPALLQPPVVAASNRADYKNTLFTPDALDMLATAKNHDVKAERIAEPTAEDWLFALVTLQTSEGYGGAGNQGASRMNGGLSNRMMLGIRPAGGAGAAFRRDVQRLLADAKAQPNARRGGQALVWLSRWDGTIALHYDRLDPLYVEICRRVRLERRGEGTVARTATSVVTRIAAKELLGKTEDPWAPIKADASASVTASGGGFGYRAMARLLNTKEVTAPLLARVNVADEREGLSIVAAALVRGQGKTEGLHRRAVRVSRVEEIDDNEQVLDRIGDIATLRTKDTGQASDKLRLALYAMLQGAPSKPGEGKALDIRLNDKNSIARAQYWTEQFNQSVDTIFWRKSFWSEAARDRFNHRLIWRDELRNVALGVFEDAAQTVPRTDMRRVRAKARAKDFLEGVLGAWLKEVA